MQNINTTHTHARGCTHTHKCPHDMHFDKDITAKQINSHGNNMTLLGLNPNWR